MVVVDWFIEGFFFFFFLSDLTTSSAFFLGFAIASCSLLPGPAPWSCWTILSAKGPPKSLEEGVERGKNVRLIKAMDGKIKAKGSFL